ncbi:histidine--tRNA ligase [Candidatus Falkowbacteria bacterium CG10_big_fil_rev_8_21_14_0_10_44_15]|uniref:Histidine--tRNA ligase n=1 Tax=Candidatus Falkowbacteria bacterium CG10_big_fil_rev_8_21_14_0_10_44_15 TaxID=1974569 RepID=A0A2H0V0V2_9BACT|nr:MAG: histidine--tRNA ligase [Candidatus Falkowbacteria bacterium CG10_big_fil_rev_8_21_14_0_10_44_15]
MSAKTIKPDLLGGFRDMLPGEAIMFQDMVATIRRVYESFGFVPLETPGMERWDVLTGNAKVEKSIFTARIVRGIEDEKVSDETWEQSYTLRFDLTVPLARVVAAYPDLPKPFKRYQLGRVWRGEKPQADRFREFYQFDFDTIGSNSILADVEVIQVMYATMVALGIQNFVIRFNTRKLLNGLAALVNCRERASEMLRVIDKLDKIGIEGVLAELQRQPDNEYDESALAFSAEQATAVQSFLEIRGDSAQDVIAQLKQLFAGKSSTGEDGIREIETIVATLRELNIPEKNWRFDLSVARGLDYYTGPVFETVLTDLPKLGSVFSGGRFDGLTNRFMPDSNIPGVGASVGVDRLLVGMQQLELAKVKETLTDVLVTIFDQLDTALQNASLQCCNEMRKAGINAELYLGEDRTLRAQLAYAQKKNIPFVTIIGPDELRQNKAQLKNMSKRTQQVLTISECVATIRSLTK